MRTSLNNKEEYINQLFAAEDESLLKIRSQLKEDGKEGINVGPYEGRLLQVLIKMMSVQSIAEVGTLYAYSTLWMARALPEDGVIYSLEKEEANFKKASELIEKTESANKVKLIQGDALEELEKLSSQGPFDMVFIDANKAGYCKYLDWAEENVKSGGLIVGDNTFLFGAVYGEPNENMNTSEKQTAIMKEFNQRLSNKDKYESVLIPTAEGLTIAIKK